MRSLGGTLLATELLFAKLLGQDLELFLVEVRVEILGPFFLSCVPFSSFFIDAHLDYVGLEVNLLRKSGGGECFLQVSCLASLAVRGRSGGLMELAGGLHRNSNYNFIS